MRKTRRGPLALLTAAALLATACGGSGSDDSDDANGSPVTLADDTATSAAPTTQAADDDPAEEPAAEETTSTTEDAATSTTVAETTTTTTPYLVFKRAGEAGGETSMLATTTAEPPVALYATVTPNRSGTLATVEWEGSYTHCIGDGPVASAFTIRMHPDGGGEPDLNAVLLDLEFPLDALNETFLPETSHPDCDEESDVPLYRFPFFSYEAMIADGPELAGGEPIWILIQAHLPDFTTFWNWRTSGLGLPPSRQLFNGEWTDSSLGASTVALTAVPE